MWCVRERYQNCELFHRVHAHTAAFFALFVVIFVSLFFFYDCGALCSVCVTVCNEKELALMIG